MSIEKRDCIKDFEAEENEAVMRSEMDDIWRNGFHSGYDTGYYDAIAEKNGKDAYIMLSGDVIEHIENLKQMIFSGSLNKNIPSHTATNMMDALDLLREAYVEDAVEKYMNE